MKRVLFTVAAALISSAALAQSAQVDTRAGVSVHAGSQSDDDALLRRKGQRHKDGASVSIRAGGSTTVDRERGDDVVHHRTVRQEGGSFTERRTVRTETDEPDVVVRHKRVHSSSYEEPEVTTVRRHRIVHVAPTRTKVTYHHRSGRRYVSSDEPSVTIRHRKRFVRYSEAPDSVTVYRKHRRHVVRSDESEPDPVTVQHRRTVRSVSEPESHGSVRVEGRARIQGEARDVSVDRARGTARDMTGSVHESGSGTSASGGGLRKGSKKILPEGESRGQ